MKLQELSEGAVYVEEFWSYVILLLSLVILTGCFNGSPEERSQDPGKLLKRKVISLSIKSRLMIWRKGKKSMRKSLNLD
jgi:hypothetical protein